jgi:hypothetical protein
VYTERDWVAYFKENLISKIKKKYLMLFYQEYLGTETGKQSLEIVCPRALATR